MLSSGTDYTITALNDSNSYIYTVWGWDNVVNYNTWSSRKLAARPTVYLKHNIETTIGNGTRDNPYELLSN